MVASLQTSNQKRDKSLSGYIWFRVSDSEPKLVLPLAYFLPIPKNMNNAIGNLKQLYETEYDRWLEETIKILNTRQLDRLDYDNLIEELEALGRNEKNAVESFLEQIIRLMLLYEYWQTEFAQNPNHSEAEIVNFRTKLKRRLTTNLINHLEAELLSIYRDALKFVKAQTKLDSFPEECPYTLKQLLDENWLPRK